MHGRNESDFAPACCFNSVFKTEVKIRAERVSRHCKWFQNLNTASELKIFTSAEVKLHLNRALVGNFVLKKFLAYSGFVPFCIEIVRTYLSHHETRCFPAPSQMKLLHIFATNHICSMDLCSKNWLLKLNVKKYTLRKKLLTVRSKVRPIGSLARIDQKTKIFRLKKVSSVSYSNKSFIN